MTTDHQTPDQQEGGQTPASAGGPSSTPAGLDLDVIRARYEWCWHASSDSTAEHEALMASSDDVPALLARVRELEAELITERGTGRAIARRDGAADALLYAHDHVGWDDREVLARLAEMVRDGTLTIPTTIETTEETDHA